MTLVQSIDGTVIPEDHALGVAARMRSLRARPFSSDAVNLLDSISTHLTSNRQFRTVGNVMALAFWLRRSNLIRMIEARRQTDLSLRGTRVARGFVLHYPPTNVDAISIYSWAISVLSGNCNIVRLPSTINEMTRLLLEVVAQQIERHGYSESHLFCKFDYDSNFALALNALADARFVWGGDAKVTAVQRIPCQPDGITVGFSDRTSLAVVNSAAFLKMSQEAQKELAKKLYNDMYWYDQVACGSPRVLVWIGESGQARVELLSALLKVVEKEGYTNSPPAVLQKFIYMNRALALGQARSADVFGPEIYSLQGADSIDLQHHQPGGGLVWHVEVRNLDEISPLLSRRTQTITYAGLGAEEIQAVIHLMQLHGGFRLVPIGNALNFEPTWDGVDLFDAATRMIVRY